MSTATEEFFARVLAPEPNHVLTLGKRGGDGMILWNQNYPDIARLAAAALRCDKQGLVVYFALGSFKDNVEQREDGRIKVTRRAAQATFFRTLAADIDVGEGKPYATQRDAAKDVLNACSATKLPAPMLVSSGWGLHCYWPLTEHIERSKWLLASQALKNLLTKHGVGLDATKVCDPAMVLRPVGTTNRKSDTEMPVRILRDAEAHDIGVLEASLQPFSEGVAPTRPAGEKRTSAALDAVLEDLPLADALEVALKCPQISAIATSGGNVPEPLWYAALGVAAFTTTPEATAIKWSEGHPKFNEAATLRKMAQWKEKTSGPATCAKFETVNPAGCAQCTHKGKVATPIQLSSPKETVFVAPATGEEIELPHGYRVQGHKIVRVVDEVPVTVSNYFLRVKERYYDPEEEKMVCMLEAHIPSEGVKQVILPIDTLAAGKDKLTSFMFNHNIAPGSSDTALRHTRLYLMSYLEELQRLTKPVDTYSHFGWTKDNSAFVLGARRFHKNRVEPVQLGHTIVGDLREAYQSAGELGKWKWAVNHLGSPGLEPHALCFFMGMGTPMMRFTDLDGMTVSMYSPQSGTGKTTTGYMINSVWGHPKTIQIGRNDTVNALYRTLTQQHNLPAYFEEITNIEPEQLSDLVYNVAHGRERRRMTEKAVLRATGKWTLLLFTSTNQSLLNKLHINKASGDGELQRLIEFPFAPNGVFAATQDGASTGSLIMNALRSNYGLAGPLLLNAMLAHEVPFRTIEQCRNHLERSFGFQFDAKERYVQAAFTVAYYAATVGSRIGLIDFDWRKVFEWGLAYVEQQRKEANRSRTDAFDLIGDYVNEHLDCAVVMESVDASPWRLIAELPRRQVHLRFEIESDTKKGHRVGTLWVGRKHFNDWLFKRKVDDIEVISQLRHDGVSVQDTRISLGRRCPALVTPSARVWEIPLRHPRLSNVLNDLSTTSPKTNIVPITGAK